MGCSLLLKSCVIVKNYIRQEIEKGFSMYINDFKFDNLSTIAYNHLLKHKNKYKVQPKLYVIKFRQPEEEPPSQPLNPELLTVISDDNEAAHTLCGMVNHAEDFKIASLKLEGTVIESKIPGKR